MTDSIVLTGESLKYMKFGLLATTELLPKSIILPVNIRAFLGERRVPMNGR